MFYGKKVCNQLSNISYITYGEFPFHVIAREGWFTISLHKNIWTISLHLFRFSSHFFYFYYTFHCHWAYKVYLLIKCDLFRRHFNFGTQRHQLSTWWRTYVTKWRINVTNLSFVTIWLFVPKLLVAYIRRLSQFYISRI